MKRFFSFILALALVFSLSITAFAAADGSITITNPTKGDTYKLYKIFSATYLPDGSDAGSDPDGVSYTLEAGSEIYNHMFTGADVTVDSTKGTRSNAFFTYTDATGVITRIEGTQNKDIFEYLTTMIRTIDPDGTKYLRIESDVQDEVVAFDGLEYGYYLIDKEAADGVDVAVTITSNTPSVNVIDKNQKPATEFSKMVWDEDYRGTDAGGNEVIGRWVSASSANIGDIVEYKVEFDATNYDGEEKIRYYSIMDTKGDSVWVEFNSITVIVDGVTLNQGFYHGVDGTHNTGEWEYLGSWLDADGNPVAKNPDNAQWYLVHYGYDKFEIVIPWLNQPDFEGNSSGFTLTFADGAESVYESPSNVVVKYTASIEPGANIGDSQVSNLWNKAELSWNNTARPGSSTAEVKVYAMGLHKVDADDNSDSLAGAVFEIYRDQACTDPVYIIPTDVKGVYILDDLYSFVSGDHRDTSREVYAAYLEEYLGPNYATTQKNEVVTLENGKVVILGLEAGDYYLKEIEAPAGYNLLPTPEKVTVGDTSNTFSIIIKDNQVLDGTQVPDGAKKYDYTATPITVENSKGVQLPSTGGEGTMMMITIGTMMAIAFAVLLITQKKMSVYHD